MNPQAIARATGVLFLITFVTSIPALLLYDPILKDNGYSTYLSGAGADNQIFLGASLELFLIIANVGTALVLFPILKRQNEILALATWLPASSSASSSPSASSACLRS